MRLSKKRNGWLKWGSKTLMLGVLLVTVFSPLISTVHNASADSQAECKARGGTWRLSTEGAITLGQSSGSYACYAATGRTNVANTPLPEGTTAAQLRNQQCNSFASCIADVVYLFTVGLGSGVAYIGAWVFSLATVLTLSSTAYALTFLSEGWSIVRDVANMFFILILVYIAFTVMLRADTAETMKRLAWVIVIALIINFSFFFVRVVIDAGNLLAVQFYNAIEAPPIEGTAAQGGVAGIAAAASSYFGQKGTKDLTAAIMNGIGAQTIINTQSFEKFQNDNNWFTELLALTFIYIALGAILFILAAAFFTIGIKFIVRTTILWLVLIAAPLALIANTIRQGEEWYQKWQKALISHAFYPAVFLFIFYILTLFMGQLTAGGNILETTFGELNGVQTKGLVYIVPLIAIIGIKLGFVIALLYIGLQVSEQMGVMGAQLASTISRKIPLMGGLKSYGRLGGVAFQRTAGLGGSLADRGLARTRIGNAPIIGRLLRTPAQTLAGAKFGGARSYKEVRESDEKWERERRDNLVNVNNRRDARRLSELEKVYDDTRLKELQKRYDERGQLAGKDAQDYDRLSKLKPEYDRLKEGVGNYRKSQLESFKASEVESIVKYLKESQLKNLQESTKFTEQEKNKFQKEWAEKAFDAPLKKANEQVLELRKLNATLKKQNITLSHLDNRLGTDTEPRHTTINMKVVSDMKDELNPRMEALKDEIRKAPRGEEHMEKRRTLRDLQKAAKKLEDLESHLKNVGPDIGGTAEGKSFDTSKVS